jgi:beta-galactosidase
VRYTDGALTGVPVLTRRAVGAGSASYLATRPDESGLLAVVDGLIELAALRPVTRFDIGLELTRRRGASGSFLFAINHDETTARMLAAVGVDLVSGDSVDGDFVVPAGGVAVIHERP